MSDIGALNAFPPEWWPGRREIDPDSGRPDGGHCPYARPLQLHWSRLAVLFKTQGRSCRKETL
jgi:hypothetical protein